MAEKGFDITMGVIRATGGWGVAEEMGVDNQIFPMSFEFPKGIEYVEDPTLTGTPFQPKDDQGNRTYEPTYTGNVLFRGGLDFILALIAGDDSGGAPVPIDNTLLATVGATHKLVPQPSVEGLYMTYAALYPDIGKVKEMPTMKVQRVELTISTGARTEYTFDGPGTGYVNDSSVNTLVTMANLTAPTPLDTIMFQDWTFRMNGQGDAALGPADDVCIESITFAWERPLAIIFDSCFAPEMNEPVTNGFFLADISVEIPQEDSLDFEDDLLADTIQKAELFATGPVLTDGDPGQDNAWRFYWPQLQITEHSDPVGGPELITQSLTLRATKAEVSPAGMTETLPYAEVDNELQTDLLA